MTAIKFQLMAHKFAFYPIPVVAENSEEHSLTYVYPALGLAEEAGEVAGKYAKAVRDCNGVISPERKQEIKKELGDVLWFVAELSTQLGFSLEEVMAANIEKLTSRKERGVLCGSGDNR